MQSILHYFIAVVWLCYLDSYYLNSIYVISFIIILLNFLFKIDAINVNQDGFKILYKNKKVDIDMLSNILLKRKGKKKEINEKKNERILNKIEYGIK